MQIRQTSNRSLLLSMLIIASLITLTLMHNNISEELYENEQRRSASFRLADQLRSNSNDLTEVVRTYVITSKREQFETYINLRATQLNILPQPLNERTIVGTQLAFIIEAEDSFESETEETNTAAALIELQKVQKFSMSLVELEKEALATLDSGGPSEAAKLLQDEAYSSARAKVLSSIDGFVAKIDQRSIREAEELTAKKDQLFKNYGFLLFIIVAATVFEFFWGTKKIIAPIEELTRVAGNMIKGDYEQRADINADNEIGVLASTFNEMAESIGQDVERRKHTEEKLQLLNKEAKDANLAKSDFLAKMSHEIRTPMNGVIGMVDLLTETKLKDDQQQMLTTVRDSAYSLLTIINDILDFSKIEAGKLELEQIPISIRDGVEGVSETLASNARNKGIQLNIHADPNIPDAVLGDPVRIRQILFNIGGNAIKFTEKGRVLIRAIRLPTSTEETVSVRFEIIDSGIGIPKEAQAQLFEEFSQAESNTTRRFGGTGLGLSICQRLVELMGGTIEVQSETGKGSTFSVTLDFPVLAHGHDIGSDGYDLSGLNILFVGVDKEECELDAKYLRYWNAEVTTTRDFRNVENLALEAIEANTPYDIVIFGSAWSLKDQTTMIESILDEGTLEGLRFVLMTESRSQSERTDINNVVYVESDPIRRANFIRGVAVAAGLASPEIYYDEEDTANTRDDILSLEEAEANGTLILVAEDNPTNRDVIGRQLKLLGYTAEFWNDGEQALNAWRSKSYAMLLTDCHMPEMDGFELTLAIRDADKNGDRHFPIIAITASALKAEVDRCYECGMDDFLAKPIEMPKLKAALKKWMPVDGTVAVPQVKIPSKAVEVEQANEGNAQVVDGPIDPNALKSVFGDDEETFKEILKDFEEPAASNIAEIEASFDDRSADGVARAAHKLKSSARSVGANDLADLCLTLETAGNADDWDEIEKAKLQLAGLMQKVGAYISTL
jgi:signal transduction histidine kinase/CheY-like chemotaxis protein/HPt (histidine-containing phosphotransfer) domain-containing protein